MAKDKFVAHRVLERVGYGVGTRLHLSASQIADRRPALQIDDEKGGFVTVAELVEFRAGEEIGIMHALTRHEEAALEPVDKTAVRKAKTSVPVSKTAKVVVVGAGGIHKLAVGDGNGEADGADHDVDADDADEAGDADSDHDEDADDSDGDDDTDGADAGGN